MAAPISKGRMIRQDISKSKKFAALSKDSKILFCMLIPHFNSYGKMNGSPHFIKGEIVPLLNMGIQRIETCLREIHKKTNVKWFFRDGMHYIHAINFENHQELRSDRRGNDLLPDYSRTSPGKVRLEVEVEVEGKGEAQSLKLKAAPKATILPTPPNTNGAEPPSGVVDEVVQFLGDEGSRAFFMKAEKNLGPGLLRELFCDMKSRDRLGMVEKPAQYLTAMIKQEADRMIKNGTNA